MTLSVFHCVLTWHQEDTDAPMRLWLVFRGVVVLHTPAYFASHHPLFGSCDSWWVAFSACAQLMLERPVDQEETCGCERQMPGPTVLRTESNLEWFTVCLHHLCRGENYVGSGTSPWWLVCVSCSTHWGETRGDERLALSSNVNWVSHHFQHGSSGQLRVKWQLLSCVL